MRTVHDDARFVAGQGGEERSASGVCQYSRKSKLGLHHGLFSWLFSQAQSTQKVVHNHVGHGLTGFSGAATDVRQQGDLVSTVGCQKRMVGVDDCRPAKNKIRRRKNGDGKKVRTLATRICGQRGVAETTEDVMGYDVAIDTSDAHHYLDNTSHLDVIRNGELQLRILPPWIFPLLS